jgi:hypothetical protein
MGGSSSEIRDGSLSLVRPGMVGTRYAACCVYCQVCARVVPTGFGWRVKRCMTSSPLVLRVFVTSGGGVSVAMTGQGCRGPLSETAKADRPKWGQAGDNSKTAKADRPQRFFSSYHHLPHWECGGKVIFTAWSSLASASAHQQVLWSLIRPHHTAPRIAPSARVERLGVLLIPGRRASRQLSGGPLLRFNPWGCCSGTQMGGARLSISFALRRVAPSLRHQQGVGSTVN